MILSSSIFDFLFVCMCVELLFVILLCKDTYFLVNSPYVSWKMRFYLDINKIFSMAIPPNKSRLPLKYASRVEMGSELPKRWGTAEEVVASTVHQLTCLLRFVNVWIAFATKTLKTLNPYVIFYDPLLHLLMSLAAKIRIIFDNSKKKDWLISIGLIFYLQSISCFW